MNEKPLLSIDAAAKFIAESYTREYRVKCLAHWREIHGDEYADRVKAKVEAIFKGKKR